MFCGLYAHLRFGVHLHISVWGTICISPGDHLHISGGPFATLRFVDYMHISGLWTICISPEDHLHISGGPFAYLRFVDRMTVIGDQMTVILIILIWQSDDT